MPQVVTANDKSPTGQIKTPNDLYIEGGPDSWFGGVPRYSPDADGYYWGITGTVAKPVYQLGCYTGFQWRDNVQMTEVRCDTIGVVSTIQKRNYLEATFTLQALFPLTILGKYLKGADTVFTDGANGVEKMGIGDIDNTLYFPFFFSKVYDPTNGYFVSVTGHRCQFVDAWDMNLQYGAPWTLGVKVRFYADANKPSAQRFATVLRWDPSRIP